MASGDGSVAGEIGPLTFTKRRARTGEEGTSGLVRYGTQVDEEFLHQLKGAKGVRVWREMRDNDSTVGASYYAMDSHIRQVPWRVDPAPDHPLAEEAAKFLEECVGDMSLTWNDFISEAFSCAWFGWTMFEKVFKYRQGPQGESPSKYNDGKLGWRKFAVRAQETLDGWEFEEDGSLVGMWQVAAPLFKRVLIPIERSILFRLSQSKGNPEGRSMLRNAYRSWFFLKRLQELEAIGIERDLVGLPHLQLPFAYFAKNATPEKKQALRDFMDMLSQIRRNEHEGIATPAELDENGKPTGFKLSLLSTGGTRQIDIGGSIQRYGKAISQSMLTGFLFLGMDSVGTQALSQSITGVFKTALGSILDTVEETVNRFAVQELMELNGYPPEAWPRLRHGEVDEKDIRPLAESLLKLVDAGLLTPDSTLEDYIRKEGRLPEREKPDGDDPDGEDPDLRGEPAESPRIGELATAIRMFTEAKDLEMLNLARAAFAQALGVEVEDITDLTQHDLDARAEEADPDDEDGDPPAKPKPEPKKKPPAKPKAKKPAAKPKA